MRSKNLYARPQIVNNSCLLKDGRSMNLKENIIEHFDFEAVSPNVWKYIYSWYSADWCIMRQLRRDRVNFCGVVLDLYPENSLIQPGQVLQSDEDSIVGLNSGLNKNKTFDDNFIHDGVEQQRYQLIKQMGDK